MIALGIDPGTAICGYGFVETHGSRLRPLAYGSIFTTPDMPMEQRLMKIFDELDALIKQHKPDVMGVELDVVQSDLPAELVDLARERADYQGDNPDEAAEVLLAARQQARAAKAWGTADAIRDGIKALGLVVEDTPAGARLSRA